MTAIATSTHRLPVAVRIGLVLATLDGLADIAVNAFSLPDVGSWLGLTIGVLTLVAVPFAWRGFRNARIGVAVTRLLSGLLALPAFFVSGVPAGGVISAAAGLVVEVVIAVLVLRPVRD
jgi:hypothetical protein